MTPLPSPPRAEPECLTLYQADFAVTLDHAREVGGADLILMSPPYCDARDYGAGIDWKLADYQRLGDAVKPALKPGGHCLMVLDAPVREWRKGYGTERGFMPWIVMLDWAERVGLRVPDRMAYGRQGVPGAYGGRFRNDWEPLLWFQSHGADGYLDRWAIAAKTSPMTGKAPRGRRGDGELATYRDPDNELRSGRAATEGWAHRGTYWNYGNVGNGHDIEGEATDHAARYCTAFAEDAVRCFAPVGGLVCDPFLGSGTSALAAIRHGRRFIGGDMLNRSADGMPWIEVARRRVAGNEVVAPQAADSGPLFAGAK